MVTTSPELSPHQWVTRLSHLHNAQIPELEILDAYYEGEQPLSYMHPELLRRLDNRVRQVVINWPQLVVDALDERLDVTGFRLGGEQAADRELWAIWQANRLDLHSEHAHIDALALGRSFAIVGTNEDRPSTPLVTVESPLDVHVDLDPRTRTVRPALKRQYDEDGDGLTEAYATLYLPNETIWYISDNGGGSGRRATATSTAWARSRSSRWSTARGSADAATAAPRAFRAGERAPALGGRVQDRHRHDGVRRVPRDAQAVRAWGSTRKTSLTRRATRSPRGKRYCRVVWLVTPTAD